MGKPPVLEGALPCIELNQVFLLWFWLPQDGLILSFSSKEGWVEGWVDVVIIQFLQVWDWVVCQWLAEYFYTVAVYCFSDLMKNRSRFESLVLYFQIVDNWHGYLFPVFSDLMRNML